MADTSPTMLELLILASLRDHKSGTAIVQELEAWHIPVTEEVVYEILMDLRTRYLVRLVGSGTHFGNCVYSSSANGRGMFRRWSGFLEVAAQTVGQSELGPWFRRTMEQDDGGR